MKDNDLDINELTEDQQLALQQFTSVTDQDLGTALSILRKTEWNIQIAIARFFDGEPPPEPEPSVPPPQSTRRQETLANGFGDLRHRARRHFESAPRIVGQLENQISPRQPFILSVLLTPFNIAISLFSRLYSIFFYLFPFLPRLLPRLSSRATPILHRSTDPRPQLAPYDACIRFQREFTAAYGEHPLPLLTSSYARAFDIAKSDVKFLLVIPLSPEHPANDEFVKNILLSPRVVEYLTDSSNNVIVWAGSVADSEPYKVASALNVTTFPSAAVIAHTPSVSSTAMSIVSRIHKPASPDDFVGVLQAAKAEHSDSLSRVRASKTEHQAERSLRDEQQSAYERSLAKDREKARARKAAEDDILQKKIDQERKEAQQEQYAQDLAQWKRWRAAQFGPEPGDDVKDTVRTSIRLLDGTKVLRRFYGQASIEDVYAFVECHDELAKVGRNNEKQQFEPSIFTPVYGFQLVSLMPREVHGFKQSGTVSQRLGRSANLIVERIEGDESDQER